MACLLCTFVNRTFRTVSAVCIIKFLMLRVYINKMGKNGRRTYRNKKHQATEIARVFEADSDKRKPMKVCASVSVDI